MFTSFQTTTYTVVSKLLL